MSDTDTPDGYEQLQELAASLKRPLRSLVVLGPENDPFLAARPARLAAAQWVADLYERLNFKPGTHVRRIHYVLVSQDSPVLLGSGEPYENTVLCAKTLYLGARDARYLGLIPANAIVDHRNPAPTIYFANETDSSAEIDIAEGYVGTVSDGGVHYYGPNLSTPSLSLSAPTIAQQYQVEIWCEKSTMNDVLMPLGRAYGVNIVTGVGELSTTRCEELVDRALASDRPVRILYISDFDPAGRSMPVAVARKIEFFAMKSGLQLDIQVRDVVLTHEQCIEYRLPRTPLKETEARSAKFEARFGEGATELDALEALHPGELQRILEKEIERYYDSDLDEMLSQSVNEIEADLDLITQQVLARHADELQALARDRDALNVEGRKEIEKVRQLMALKEEAYDQRAQQLLTEISEELEAERPDADDYEWPEAAEGDEDPDPMYDSTRTFMEQMDRYRAHQGKPVEAVLWQDRKFPLVCQNPRCGKNFTSSRSTTKVCSDKCRNAIRPKRDRQAGMS